MNDNDLEYLIAQYADGSLAPERVAEVEAVLRRDAGARSALESYRRVDAALAGATGAVPLVRWDKLAATISGRVAAIAAGPVAVAEETEEQLSRLAAGELSADERAAADAALATVPAARVMLADYAALNRAFDAARASSLVPTVQWDNLAAHLSAAVAETEESTAARTGVWGRIGNWAKPRWVAAAACVLLTAGLGIRLAVTGGDGNGVPGDNPQQTTAVVPSTGPAGGGNTEVVVGPTASPAMPTPDRIVGGPKTDDRVTLITTFVARSESPADGGAGHGGGDVAVQIGPGGQAATGNGVASGGQRPAGRSIVFGERVKPQPQDREASPLFPH